MTDNDSPQPTYRPVKTVKTSMRIVEYIMNREGAGLSQIADEIGVAKSTVYRHLNTLCEEGFVVRDGDTYDIGIRFLDPGIYARNRQPGYQLAAKKTRELALESGELCTYMIEDGGRGYVLCCEEGSNAIATSTRVGKPTDLHATAGGKCILAHLPDERVAAILDRRGLDEYTPETITEREALMEELEQIRKRGHAYSRAEYVKGLYSVAEPVFDEEDRVLGALCATGPMNRMRDERFTDQLPDILMGAVNELELNITYS